MTLADAIAMLGRLPPDSKWELTVTPEWDYDEIIEGEPSKPRMARRFVELCVVQELPTPSTQQGQP